MSILHWPMAERPRERLLNLGPKHLTDAELVAIFYTQAVRGYQQYMWRASYYLTLGGCMRY